MISYDFLKLIAQLSKSQYKEQQQISQTMENFYDQCNAIISNQCLDLHQARLIVVTEHVKAAAFAAELKGVYNELYQKDPTMALEMISKSHIPTKKELEEPITPFK